MNVLAQPSPLLDSVPKQALCQKCGKLNDVIKQGLQITRLRGNVQRYQSKVCGNRFTHTPYVRMRFPDWVCDAVLEAKVKGLRAYKPQKAVSNEAERRNEKAR